MRMNMDNENKQPAGAPSLIEKLRDCADIDEAEGANPDVVKLMRDAAAALSAPAAQPAPQERAQSLEDQAADLIYMVQHGATLADVEAWLLFRPAAQQPSETATHKAAISTINALIESHKRDTGECDESCDIVAGMEAARDSLLRPAAQEAEKPQVGTLAHARIPGMSPMFGKAQEAAREQPADERNLYEELLYAVSMKHPGETRHETALRYIRQAESVGRALAEKGERLPDESPDAPYIEGGRESVDDALEVVDSFGPGIEGLNDAFARQIILAAEVRRLRALYDHAVSGRSTFRDAFRKVRDAVFPPLGCPACDLTHEASKCPADSQQAPSTAAQERGKVVWVDAWGATHTMTIEGAARFCKEHYDAWPGGLEEIDAALAHKGAQGDKA